MTLAAILFVVAAAVAQSPQGAPAAIPGHQQQPGAVSPAPAAPEDALQLQVALDRAGFSPGIIDGNMGPNTRRALEAYTKQHANQEMPSIEAVVSYRVTPEDAAGPFTPDIPSDLVEQGKLSALGYRSVLELLAERFHCTPHLLQRLNPGARFADGEEILVPNVEPLNVAAEAPQPEGGATQPPPTPRGTSGTMPAAAMKKRPEVLVTVSKSTSTLTVEDATGRVIMFAPVTTGSEHDPLPIGEWKVNGVHLNPKFHYNPDLFWDANPSHSKATIPPGPNNPVGVVWIDLSKEHYGIHGTPEPAAIGRAQSHGCVRLTNWDALKLAGLVKPGTKVVFTR